MLAKLKKTSRKLFKKTVISSFILLSLLITWQMLITLFHLPSYILPSPLQVFLAFSHHATILCRSGLVTLMELLYGLFFGILVAILSVCAMLFFRPLRFWLLPLLLTSQALPVFAIAPLLVIWMGYGMPAIILTTAFMLFFPLASAFYDGLRQTPAAWQQLAFTYNTKKSRYFWYIQLPAALPAAGNGLRIATAIAPIGAIIGEWVGAGQGLGYLILNANASLQIDLLFAGLLILVSLTLLLYFTVDRLLHYFIPWSLQ